MIDAEYMEMISARVADIEQSLADPATLSNRDRYRELLTEHAHL